ncbi:MAG: anti-sigma F factor [Clostridia bacterium]|nr:anti-sigma F factor [Clostridia bacterium]
MQSPCKNKLKLTLPSLSVNEGAARAIVSAFCAQLNPTASELADIKCAVSEAVTNCIVHAYPDAVGEIYIAVKFFDGRKIKIEIKDKGRGIEDINLARTPLYTTDKSGERSGMGFSVMESFMDKVTLASAVGRYTRVVLTKTLSPLEV